MPQTRFVTQKAFAQGLKPILVINKVDRPGARPDWVADQVFELFDNLGATDEQLDFPIIYASALEGWATLDIDTPSENMNPLLDAILEWVQPPAVDPEGPLQLQVTSLDYSSYVGVIGVGRITRGQISKNQTVSVVDSEGNKRNGKVLQVLGYTGLKRLETEQAFAGDIIAFTGIPNIGISDTICDVNNPEALPPMSVDEPTVSMTFQVNNSPFVGKAGKFLTSRQILERLEKELIHNVALRVEETNDADKFKVSGRGELHLSILIENMRREGYELGVSKPEVIFKEIDGVVSEPYESLTVDIEEQHQGAIMERLGERKGQLRDMVPDGNGRVRLDYTIPSRGLIGFQTEFLTATSGTGLIYHTFEEYGPVFTDNIGARQNGVLISNGTGKALGFALFNLQERGRLMINANDEVYEGQIVGIHARDNDLVVNPLKGKQLTNIRASGSDENIILTPPIKMSLEQALEFIDDDELVEVTPDAIRVRKKILSESDRKKASRKPKEK